MDLFKQGQKYRVGLSIKKPSGLSTLSREYKKRKRPMKTLLALRSPVQKEKSKNTRSGGGISLGKIQEAKVQQVECVRPNETLVICGLLQGNSEQDVGDKAPVDKSQKKEQPVLGSDPPSLAIADL